MEPEPVIYREEAVAMLFAIQDMNENLAAIREFFGGGDGGEEGLPEDDA
ncbi:MAG: hypothetical protein H0V68_01420 [Actinobacteria bacterium]|nr:hypothetical protein [Actinomycetota bacterium]